MKFVKCIVKGKFSLHLDDEGNFGLNVATGTAEPWYVLDDWNSFKTEVDQAFNEQRRSLLSSFSIHDLEKEIMERHRKQV